MGYGVSIPVFILLGCAVLAHCQRPPADDEDFPFSHEGSGRAVLAPPPSSGAVVGSVVNRPPPPPVDHGAGGRDDRPTYHGSGYGDDEDYEGGEYDYDLNQEGDDYYDDDDYYEDEYENYDDKDGEEPAGGGSAGHGQQEHRTPLDHFGPEVVVPDHHPEDDHNIGVVHAAPPPLPEHVDRPDHFGELGSERGRQTPPPVFGTEIRPTETSHREPPVESERDNGIEIAPEVDLHSRPDGSEENDIPDGTVGGQPTDADPESESGEEGLPDGMGSKAIDRDTSFFAQPGILAAVVGGAVVGLLCAILLVMLIVYRMRKKDEGSYALDEPKRSLTGNSYSKNYNKEFYA